ncbi:MAG TPA: capreomycidine synthase, partial [Micromonosporaceae bacterium]|nr:capreomycidine synthase [Micromonosporaceae bacterium]
ALLEDWLRDYYFAAEIDLGGSGVEDYAWGELRRLVDLPDHELDGLVLCDGRPTGGLELRRAVAERWGNGDPDWVLTSHGSSEAIYLVLNSLLRPGDEVVVPAPMYFAFPSIAEAIGCRVREWPLRPADGFAADIAEACRLIGPRTRMVVANFPHNPTGSLIGPAELAELTEAAARVGAYLLWDGALAELVYDEPALPPPVLAYDRAIALGTFSKAYGLPGLRFGWCLADPAVLASLLPLRDRMTLHLSPLVELVARAVVERAGVLLAPRLAQASRNRLLVAAWAARHADLLDLVPPRGGVTAFPRLPRVDDVRKFCRRLADERAVLLVPGDCFGFPDRVRLGFGGPTAAVAAGLGHLAELLVDEALA